MPLEDRIAELLGLPAAGSTAPSLDRLETTLTDGYAEALALEAERLRIERRRGEIDVELARLRPLLVSLDERRRTIRRAS